MIVMCCNCEISESCEHVYGDEFPPCKDAVEKMCSELQEIIDKPDNRIVLIQKIVERWQ